MLCEGDLALFLDEFFRLHSCVEVQLDFLQALKHALFVVNSLLAEFFLEVLLGLHFSHQLTLTNLHVAVH